MIEQLPDIPRLYTAIAEWGACLTYMSLFIRALPLWRFLTSAIGGLGLLVGVQIGAELLPVSLWIPGMLAAVISMAMVMRVGVERPLTDILHMTLRAFILAEFAASLAWQLVVFFFFSSNQPSELFAWWRLGPILLLVATYVMVFSICWFLESRNIGPHIPFTLDRHDLWMTVSITIATFAMSNLSFISTSTPFSGRLGPEVFYIRTLVDLCGFAALYAQHERVTQIRTASELASIQSTLSAQHSQYLQSKADIEAIGRAHHDLKHHIAVLRAEMDPELKNRDFEELERSVNEMGQQYYSGNPVLDVILTSKGTACVASHIQFTAVADGSLLNGMTSMDIATLFGNVLDNAIEASRFVEDPAKRIIQLLVRQQGEMVVIRISNWFTTPVHTGVDGALLTHKTDRTHHGFGVKSIRYTAEKYGGEVTTSIKDHWFTLTVLLPNISSRH